MAPKRARKVSKKKAPQRTQAPRKAAGKTKPPPVMSDDDSIVFSSSEDEESEPQPPRPAPSVVAKPTPNKTEQWARIQELSARFNTRPNGPRFNRQMLHAFLVRDDWNIDAAFERQSALTATMREVLDDESTNADQEIGGQSSKAKTDNKRSHIKKVAARRRETIEGGAMGDQDTFADDDTFAEPDENAPPSDEHRRRELARGLNLHVKDKTQNKQKLSISEALLLAYEADWDLDQAKSQFQSVQAARSQLAAEYDPTRTPLPMRIKWKDPAIIVPQNERLARFISITGRPDWTSLRACLANFQWDLIAALVYWFRHGVRPLPKLRKGELRFDANLNRLLPPRDWRPHGATSDPAGAHSVGSGGPDSSGDDSSSNFSDDDSDDEAGDARNRRDDKDKEGENEDDEEMEESVEEDKDYEEQDKDEEEEERDKEQDKDEEEEERDKEMEDEEMEDEADEADDFWAEEVEYYGESPPNIATSIQVAPEKDRPSSAFKDPGFLIGKDRATAKRGPPDEKKFLIEAISRGRYMHWRFRHSFQWPEVRGFPLKPDDSRALFDWSNQKNVETANNYRRQQLARITHHKVRPGSQKWSDEESAFLMRMNCELFEVYLGENPGKPLDDIIDMMQRVSNTTSAEWARRLNAEFMGTIQPGDKKPREERTASSILTQRRRDPAICRAFRLPPDAKIQHLFD